MISELPMNKNYMSRVAWKEAQEPPHKLRNTLCTVYPPKVRFLGLNVGCIFFDSIFFDIRLF